ncbi:MAG TPA: beta-ketoacyl-[acyl-carrier-protein] synthase family protein [Thermoanaerobaculia bacterium]|jgi:3-oxoacyl-[acyl-carrier-protein] synthase II|nr:beta-ketoacyl-[acyl-carrier-protein] synthase family protein [Thermoanaerobaculia bacterium]
MVTGLGAVSAAGWGVAPLRRALCSGRTLIGPFDRLDHARQRTHVAGQVPSGPTAGGDDLSTRDLSIADRFAIFAAMEAVADAELALPLDGARVGVFFGSTTGGLYETERYLEAIVRRPDSRPPRSLLVSHSLGAPAEAVARHLGIEGPVETVSSACCSGGLAIEQALRAVRSGEVDVALAGGADVLCLTTYSGFNALRAVADGPCRPFRADRSGMSLGEGGATLVLESLDHLRSRAGRALAELLGAGSSCDASHMTAPHAGGLGAAQAIERSLEDSGIGPGDVDLINAHATGTPLNDAAESAAFARVFGDRASAIPVEATKGMLGHLLGTAGAIEAVSAVIGLLEKQVHPTSGGDGVDPALSVRLVHDAPLPMPELRTVLSVSLGFGGANAAVVLRETEGP